MIDVRLYRAVSLQMTFPASHTHKEQVQKSNTPLIVI